MENATEFIVFLAEERMDCPRSALRASLNDAPRTF
jgi:hypothetical protein